MKTKYQKIKMNNKNLCIYFVSSQPTIRGFFLHVMWDKLADLIGQ